MLFMSLCLTKLILILGLERNADVTTPSTHTQGMKIAIEGDIKGAFPSLNHDKLALVYYKNA